MWAAALIVFRESLEAALIIGVIAAATRSIAGRSRWIAAGVAVGAAGALLLAVATRSFPDLFGDSGQDLFNATVLGIAVAMLAWHNVWMARHGAELAADARAVGQAVVRGDRSLLAVAVLVGVAVLREGAETVLFMAGLASGGAAEGLTALSGAALGLAAGAGLGALIYFGLVRVPMRALFGVTAALLLLLAAGMAGQAAKYLIQGDLLPPLASPLWDTSDVLPVDGPVGAVLHLLMGYEAQPSGMQVLFFAVTLLVIAAGMWRVRQTPPRRPPMAVTNPA